MLRINSEGRSREKEKELARKSQDWGERQKSRCLSVSSRMQASARRNEGKRCQVKEREVKHREERWCHILRVKRQGCLASLALPTRMSLLGSAKHPDSPGLTTLSTLRDRQQESKTALWKYWVFLRKGLVLAAVHEAFRRLNKIYVLPRWQIQMPGDKTKIGQVLKVPWLKYLLSHRRHHLWQPLEGINLSPHR